MANKKSAKKEARKAIPYIKIAALVEQGFGAMEIAKKLNRVTPGKDGSHSIRAIISKMRTAGYRVGDKVVKLKIKRVGFDPKPTKKATPKKAAAKKAVAAAGGQ